MRIYVAFDDTDILDCGRGTGKLARYFKDELPEECKLWGVIRQQLFVHESIPMTSHNSSLCDVIEVKDYSCKDEIIQKAVEHIKNNFFHGSDPGLCVVQEDDPGLDELVQFGIKCTQQKVTQKEAMHAARHSHLSGHGGTNDGIIGAAAAIGLTLYGKSGRFVEYSKIRAIPEITNAQCLFDMGIEVMSINRHAEFICPRDFIFNQGSLRPHLWNGKPIIPVVAIGNNSWNIIHDKKMYE